MMPRSGTAADPSFDILRAAFDACPLAIGVAVERRFVAVNPAMTRLFGYAREQMLGAPARMLYASDEAFERVGRAHLAACARNERFCVENEFVTRDGRRFPGLFYARAVDPDDLSKGIVGVIEDITECKRIHSNLRERNDLIETLLQHVPASVFVKDARSWQYAVWNPVSEKMYGIAQDQALGRTDFELFPREFAQALRSTDEEALVRPGPVDIPNRHITARSGRESVIHTRKVAVPDAAGEPRWVVGMSLDVTEARRTEEALRSSEARLQHLLSASPAVIYCAKAHGGYGATFISANVREQLGYAPEDFVNDSGFWANNIHPDDRERVLAQQALLFTQGRITVEYRFRHKDGSWRWMRDEAVLVRDTAGESLELVGSWIDITARKQAEDALADALRAKSEFMANVTHELRTPLNAVIGFVELLKDEVPGPLNAKQAAFAADILASGQRLLALVEGILEMSRFDTGSAALQREPVEIGAALEECVAARRQAAVKRGITLALEVAPDAGNAALDPKALRRILDALLDNAIKFNRDGGAVALSARRAGGALEIAVADTGIGIARENLAKLFKPLVQLDSGRAREYGGIGLGLALARRLAELHGGTIEVESEPGKSSTFMLRLPIQEKA